MQDAAAGCLGKIVQLIFSSLPPLPQPALGCYWLAAIDANRSDCTLSFRTFSSLAAEDWGKSFSWTPFSKNIYFNGPIIDT